MENQPLNNQFTPGGLPPAIPLPLQDGINPFVRRTYTVFVLSLVGICATGFLSYALLPRAAFLPLAIADGVMWVACGWFGWRRPVPLVLPLFSLVTGLFLGQVAHYSTQAFMLASILSLVTFTGLTCYVHLTRTNFSFLSGFLCVSFFILVAGSLLGLFFQWPWMHLGMAAFGTLIFAGWILYDTSQILERVDDELTPEVAAFDLILDIVGLHSWLLDLLGELGLDPRH